MEIGEPLRSLIVEPLELPINEPQDDLEPIAAEHDTEGEPVSK